MGSSFLPSKRKRVLELVVASSRGKGCCCPCCGIRKSAFGVVNERNSGSEEKSSWGFAGGGSGLAGVIDDERKKTRNKEWEDIGRKDFMIKVVLKSVNVTNGKVPSLYIPLVK